MQTRLRPRPLPLPNPIPSPTHFVTHRLEDVFISGPARPQRRKVAGRAGHPVESYGKRALFSLAPKTQPTTLPHSKLRFVLNCSLLASLETKRTASQGAARAAITPRITIVDQGTQHIRCGPRARKLCASDGLALVL